MTESDGGLSPGEAVLLLALNRRAEADLRRAFEESSEFVFGEREDDEAFEERWGARVTQVYLEGARSSISRFVEHAYLGAVEDADGLLESLSIAPDEAPPRPPLSPDEIESIEDDRLRALAWDLDAVARAIDYAADPTLPDLAREQPQPWIPEADRVRLELARRLLASVYRRLSENIGDELAAYRRDE